MVNLAMPCIHIVKGRPRHPASQGSVERSHDPYKKSLLAKLKENNTADWVKWMHIVQCEVNNRPVRSRGNIKPYTLYYNQANKLSYSAALGPSYKEAKTEYGLRLAKMVLDKVMQLDESRVLSQDEVSHIVKCGDTLFTNISDSLKAAAVSCLLQLDYEVADGDVGEDYEEAPGAEHSEVVQNYSITNLPTETTLTNAYEPQPNVAHGDVGEDYEEAPNAEPAEVDQNYSITNLPTETTMTTDYVAQPNDNTEPMGRGAEETLPSETAGGVTEPEQEHLSEVAVGGTEHEQEDPSEIPAGGTERDYAPEAGAEEEHPSQTTGGLTGGEPRTKDSEAATGEENNDSYLEGNCCI
jgi:hypothetical protein